MRSLRFRSLRFRFAAAVLVGHLVLVTVGTFVAVRIGDRAITRQFDDGLVTQASLLASLLEQEGNHVGIELDETYMRDYFPGDDPDYFELFYNGIPFGRSPALGDADLTHRAGTLDQPEFWNEVLPDGRQGRCVGLSVTVEDVEPGDDGALPEPARVALVLAKSRAPLERASSMLFWGLLAGDALLLVVGLIVTWVVVSRSLGPVRVFARRVGDVDVHTLSEPIATKDVPAELLPIAAAVNGLLARLDTILRAERRSTSNIAHELMTPIAELRALSEVALQDGIDPAYRKHALGEAHDIAIQMANLIHMVRQLSAVHGATDSLPAAPVPIAGVVERVLDAVHQRAADRSLRVEVDVNGEVVLCNEDAFLSVCNNLVGNAVEYTPEGGSVELHSFAAGDSVTLRFANDCPDLSEEHLAHLTEPFWRHSMSRTDSSHLGLGLTIAQGMAALAGIDLRFRLEDERFVAEAVARVARNAS